MHAGKCTLLVSDFNQIWMWLQTSVKLPNIRFREYPFSGSRVVTCGETDMAKLKPVLLQQNSIIYNYKHIKVNGLLLSPDLHYDMSVNN
jgi:hypothetical protein